MRPVVAMLAPEVAAGDASGDVPGSTEAGTGVAAVVGAADPAADGVEPPHAARTLPMSMMDRAPPRRRIEMVMSVGFPLE
jgi:hypothetical protein